MILEGLVTTTGETGSIHLAPMGPIFDANLQSFLLRPFPTSQTYRNLVRHREGVFHTTDDARLIAYAAVGAVADIPPSFAASQVAGFILKDACRAFEFVVRTIDDSEQRVKIHAEIVAKHSLREFLGFNRAKHAIVEAAILATRFHLLPAAEITSEFAKFRIIVDKTGAPAEDEAMRFLEQRWLAFRTARVGS